MRQPVPIVEQDVPWKTWPSLTGRRFTAPLALQLEIRPTGTTLHPVVT